MMGTMTLAEFLLARIRDDECLARMAFGDHNDNKPDWSEPSSGIVDMKGEDVLLTGDSGVSRHIVNFDPARVLAECAAKRRIIEDWGKWETYNGEELMQELASVYADHPDFLPEWKL